MACWRSLPALCEDFQLPACSLVHAERQRVFGSARQERDPCRARRSSPFVRRSLGLKWPPRYPAPFRKRPLVEAVIGVDRRPLVPPLAIHVERQRLSRSLGLRDRTRRRSGRGETPQRGPRAMSVPRAPATDGIRATATRPTWPPQWPEQQRAPRPVFPVSPSGWRWRRPPSTRRERSGPGGQSERPSPQDTGSSPHAPPSLRLFRPRPSAWNRRR